MGEVVGVEVGSSVAVTVGDGVSVGVLVMVRLGTGVSVGNAMVGYSEGVGA